MHLSIVYVDLAIRVKQNGHYITINQNILKDKI